MRDVKPETTRDRLARITADLVTETLPGIVRGFGCSPLPETMIAEVAASYASQLNPEAWSDDAKEKAAGATDGQLRNVMRATLVPKLRKMIAGILEGRQ